MDGMECPGCPGNEDHRIYKIDVVDKQHLKKCVGYQVKLRSKKAEFEPDVYVITGCVDEKVTNRYGRFIDKIQPTAYACKHPKCKVALCARCGQKLYEHGPRLARPEKEYKIWHSINKTRKLRLLKDDKPKKRNVTLWSGPGQSHK